MHDDYKQFRFLPIDLIKAFEMTFKSLSTLLLDLIIFLIIELNSFCFKLDYLFDHFKFGIILSLLKRRAKWYQNKPKGRLHSCTFSKFIMDEFCNSAMWIMVDGPVYS